MAFCAVPLISKIRSRPVFAQLYSVHFDAGFDFQRVDASRGAAAGRMVVDVDCAGRLLFLAASRWHCE
jgi:hypothetical protein